MASRRIARLNEQIKREIAEIIRTEVKDPRVGTVIVTGARVAPDLSSARIYVMLTGEHEERMQSLEGLAKASSFMRVELGKRLKLRRVPEIYFDHDTSLDYGMHIEKLLSGVRPDPEAEANEDEAEG